VDDEAVDPTKTVEACERQKTEELKEAAAKEPITTGQ
jgi:hypothetical protein